MKIHNLLSMGILALPALSLAASERSREKPNILFILADDFGYGSPNCYGSDPSLVRTPNIDLLAKQGIRFTDASTPCSVSSPTRYALLTGSYPWRSDLKFGVNNVNDPLQLDTAKTSLASWLRNTGYSTAMIGKWHLGYGKARMRPADWVGKLKPGPLQVGFDYHFGVPQNHGDASGIYVENDMIWGLRSTTIKPGPKSYHGVPVFGFDAPQRVYENTMEILTGKATDWLKKQDGKKPFFLYFAPVAVHIPVTPSGMMKGKSNCGAYGDYIQDLDYSLGQLLKTLDEMGFAKNTIVFFTSDNGGEIPVNPEMAEVIAREAGLKSNGDLRGDKHTVWEGGVRVPFIVRWPGKIPQGTVSDVMINNTVDIYATFMHLITGKRPGRGEAGPDSFSFLESLSGKKPGGKHIRSSMIISSANGILAVRKGPWKYIEGKYPDAFPEARRKQKNQEAKRQLYNLTLDPAETKDVIEENPEIAEMLQRELDIIRTPGSGWEQ